ncbi:unnamed protein product [Staurois parvus]|uniref:Uncharacterized protein n=1 Tax=Staurois parvus TaxID=386267 RepID=A0ABN9EQ13_9NEOB|nr:unnamed protein product [Staurois parvus]
MPPCGSDLLLLTWRVTRPFSARCFVPHRPHGYRLGLSDLAPVHSSTLTPQGPLSSSSTTSGYTQGPRPGLGLLQVHPHHQGPW